jgi:hypothetical protein
MNSRNKHFVIQEHSTDDNTHWDLMLETENTLQTFRLDTSPRQILYKPAHAQKIHDHPIKFLTYQGPVQNGNANVKIVDSGTYTVLHRTNEKIEMHFTGEILNGRFALTLLSNNTWNFARQKP